MPLVAFAVVVLAQAAPIEAVRERSLSGTVVDRAGKPVSGAAIYLAGRSTHTQWNVSVIQGESRSDAEGRFTVALDKTFADEDPAERDLIVHHPGYAIAANGKRGRAMFMTRPLRVVLEPADAETYLVVGPDGKPIAGARVSSASDARSNAVAMPAELAERLAVRTDAQGRATISQTRASVYSVRVTTEHYGVQCQVGLRSADSVQKIELAPVGRLSLRIDNLPAEFTSFAVFAVTLPGNGGSFGDFTISPDNQGRSHLPAVVAGRIVFSPRGLPSTTPYTFEFPAGSAVQANHEAEITLRARRRAHLRGVVLEKESARPIAHVSVPFRGAGESLSNVCAVRTDARGHFDAYFEPGKFIASSAWPSQYIPAPGRNAPIQVPPDGSDVELPPIELVRAGNVKGRVTDDNAKPVSGVLVNVLWRTDTHPSASDFSLAAVRGPTDGNGQGATSNADGEFVIEGLPPNVDLWLAAGAGDVCSATLVPARADDHVQHIIQVSRDNTRALSGRLVDEFGKPIVKLPVRIHSRVRLPDGSTALRATWPGTDQDLVTDTEGKFETTRIVRPYEEYRVSPILPSAWSGETGWYASTTPSFFTTMLYRSSTPPDQVTIRREYDAGSRAIAKGDNAEAERRFRSAVDEATRRDLNDPSLTAWMQGLATAYQNQHKYADSESLYVKILEFQRKQFGSDHFEIPASMFRLGRNYDLQKKFTEAESTLQGALVLAEKLHGVESPQYARGLLILGLHHEMLGEYDEATNQVQKSLAIRERALGLYHPELVDNLTSLARCAIAQLQAEAAKVYLQRALTLREQSAGADHPSLIEILDPYAALLRRTGRTTEANKLENRAKAIRSKRSKTRDNKPESTHLFNCYHLSLIELNVRKTFGNLGRPGGLRGSAHSSDAGSRAKVNRARKLTSRKYRRCALPIASHRPSTDWDKAIG